MRPLTLSEMADELGLSTKTFSADVKAKGIPFIAAGKRQRFDPDAVKAYLTTTDNEPKSNVRQFPVSKKRKAKVVSRKFAEAR
jgi:excisionase family DNA binding protein